jgi:deoxyribose-phosphate aldolase
MGMMTEDTGEIAKMIDISAVRADSTLDEVQQAAELAITFGCAAVFALPAHTPMVVDLLAGHPMLTGGVVGFPGGADTSRIKAMTAAELVHMGCGEIDMVNNLAWLKAGKRELYVADVRGVVEAAEGRPVKVILECHWLSTEEIVRACQWCAEAGAAWVKTGTGWAPTGATLQNVSLMKQTVGDRCGCQSRGWRPRFGHLESTVRPRGTALRHQLPRGGGHPSCVRSSFCLTDLFVIGGSALPSVGGP